MDQARPADGEALGQLDGSLPASLQAVCGLVHQGRPSRLLAQWLPHSRELAQRPCAGLLPQARLGAGQVYALYQGNEVRRRFAGACETSGRHVCGRPLPRGRTLGCPGREAGTAAAEGPHPAHAARRDHSCRGKPAQAARRVAHTCLHHATPAQRHGRWPCVRGELAQQGACERLGSPGRRPHAQRCLLRRRCDRLFGVAP
mmetsp:Transcript_106354/g.227122  ORF Transcript_106354/g.227122 Transcript_106354/m.227122 type:complete len:201 (+) Transcript_106354:288-890(+)